MRSMVEGAAESPIMRAPRSTLTLPSSLPGLTRQSMRPSRDSIRKLCFATRQHGPRVKPGGDEETA